MAYTYYNCTNLTGSPACGNKVTNMAYAYYNCRKLSGGVVVGQNVTNMYYTYYYAANLHGNMYVYSPSVNVVRNCLYSRNTSNRLNIYVLAGTTSNTYFHGNYYTNSIVGVNITWTNAGTYQYNTTRNIYIYPVANIEEARIANGE
jgi:hypothetical protein